MSTRISIKCSFSSQAKRQIEMEHALKWYSNVLCCLLIVCWCCCCSCSCCYMSSVEYVCCMSRSVHDATKCNTQNKTENNIRKILKNLTRIFSSSSCVLCSWCSSSLIDTLLSGCRCASSIACETVEWNIRVFSFKLNVYIISRSIVLYSISIFPYILILARLS